MASFPQPPTRIKLRRDAIIHAIAFHDDMYAVGDDEALTVVDARTDHSIRRFEDLGTVLSVCFVGDRVAAGTLRGVVSLRKICDHETWDRSCGCGSDELALAPAGSEGAGVRAIAAAAQFLRPRHRAWLGHPRQRRNDLERPRSRFKRARHRLHVERQLSNIRLSPCGVQAKGMTVRFTPRPPGGHPKGRLAPRALLVFQPPAHQHDHLNASLPS